jgi:hypothetical protein
MISAVPNFYKEDRLSYIAIEKEVSKGLDIKEDLERIVSIGDGVLLA